MKFKTVLAKEPKHILCLALYIQVFLSLYVALILVIYLSLPLIAENTNNIRCFNHYFLFAICYAVFIPGSRCIFQWNYWIGYRTWKTQIFGIMCSDRQLTHISKPLGAGITPFIKRLIN